MSAKDEEISKQSMNLGEFNKERLLEMFPVFRTEGGGVDFDRLKLALGESVDVGKEVFGMRWPGKAASIRLANAPSHGTLSPDEKESVNFDTTQNLIIEGDNLEVLKLMRNLPYFKEVVDSDNNEVGWTPVLWAAARGEVEILQELVDGGA